MYLLESQLINNKGTEWNKQTLILNICGQKKKTSSENMKTVTG